MNKRFNLHNERSDIMTMKNGAGSSDGGEYDSDVLLQQVINTINCCDIEETEAIQEFENVILKHTPTMQQHLEQLYDVSFQLRSSQKTGSELAQVIASTYEVAEGVSGKIRQLHLAQARVSQVLELVEGYIDMKSCAEGVEQAIKQEDYEKATEYISRVLRLERISETNTSLVSTNITGNIKSDTVDASSMNHHDGGGHFSEKTTSTEDGEQKVDIEAKKLKKIGTTPTTPHSIISTSGTSIGSGSAGDDFIQSNIKKNSEVFKQAESKIKYIVSKKFQDSINHDDIESIDRFAALFAPLGIEFQGLQMYCQYICKKLSTELNDLLKEHLEEAGNIDIEIIAKEEDQQKLKTKLMYTDLLIHVFDTVASYLEQHEQYVEQKFGLQYSNQYQNDGNDIDNLSKEVINPIHLNSTIIYLLKEVINVCDDICIKILRELKKRRKLEYYVKQVENKQSTGHTIQSNGKSNAGETTMPDPKKMDLLLGELALIFGQYEIIRRFFSSMAEDALLRIFEEEKEARQRSHILGNDNMIKIQNNYGFIPLNETDLKLKHVKSSILMTKLFEEVMNIAGIYITLDEYFMRGNIKKAIMLTANEIPDTLKNRFSAMASYYHQNSDDEDDYSEEELDLYQQHKISSVNKYAKRSTKESSTKNVEKEVDELNEEDEELDFLESEDEDDDHDKCSQYVSDVFMILKKSIERSTSTTNDQVIPAVLNHTILILNTEFKAELLKFCKYLHNQHSDSYSGKNNILYIILGMNNLDLATEYVFALKQEIEKQLNNEEVFQDEQQKSSILERYMLEFTQTANEFKEKSLRHNIQALVSKRLKDDILITMETLFSRVNYNLSEKELYTTNGNDVFAQNFTQYLDDMVLSSFQPLMTLKCFDMLVQEIVLLITQRLETLTLQKKFSQIGALQFDKDIRSLLSFFSSKTHQTVRDKFARLTQIASVLKVIKLGDILEYWGDDTVTWRFTANEVKNILRLRSGISEEAIQKLLL